MTFTVEWALSIEPLNSLPSLQAAHDGNRSSLFFTEHPHSRWHDYIISLFISIIRQYLKLEVPSLSGYQGCSCGHEHLHFFHLKLKLLKNGLQDTKSERPCSDTVQDQLGQADLLGRGRPTAQCRVFLMRST